MRVELSPEDVVLIMLATLSASEHNAANPNQAEHYARLGTRFASIFNSWQVPAGTYGKAEKAKDCTFCVQEVER